MAFAPPDGDGTFDASLGIGSSRAFGLLFSLLVVDFSLAPTLGSLVLRDPPGSALQNLFNKKETLS